MPFVPISTLTVNTPVSQYPCKVYRHEKTGMQAVLLDVPGPLCFLSVVVPTVCQDNRGLPHTLEHRR
jgi:Zn-dependent M16 (insulinase) family peptidase